MNRRLRLALLAILVTLTVLFVAMILAFVGLSRWANSDAGRHWAETELSEIMGRQIRLAELDVSWERPWRAAWYSLPVPVLLAHQVEIGNPDWATHQHFATADRLRLKIALFPLLDRRLIFQRIVIENGRLQFERTTEGRNNWRFGDESRSSPSRWSVQFNSVRLDNSTLRYTDTAIDLDLEAHLTATRSSADDDATQFTLQGHYRKAELKGDGTAGALISLTDPAVNYPFLLRLQAGEVRLEAQGHIGNLRVDPAVDLRVDVSGPSMALLYPLTGLVLPRTAPFHTQGQLQGTLGESQALWEYRNFTGQMGDSDIEGTLGYRSQQPRPLLTAHVSSKQLQLVDLGPLIGLGPQPHDPAADEPAPPPPKAQRLIPDVPFMAQRWAAMDVDLDYRAERLLNGERLITQNATAKVQLKDEQMLIQPLSFSLGGGSVEALFKLDGRDDPVKGEARIDLNGLQLQQLLGAADKEAGFGGTVKGFLQLQGHGNSMAQLLGSGNGTLKLNMGEGHILRSALEMVALDILNVALTKAFGDKSIPITCAVAEFDVKKGIAHSTNVQMQTSIAYLDVDGSINLGRETLALTIHPHTLAPRLFSLRSPIEIHGSFRRPQVKIEEGPLLLRAGVAAALAVLAPPALALLPLTQLGSEKPAPCHIAPQQR